MGIDPLSILGLFAPPAVFALHWLRRRFPPRRVSALFLFGDVDRTTIEGPRRDSLRASPSFWLEMAAAVVFAALLLIDPSPSESTHHVFVLDGSASLRAAVGGESVRDRIRAEVEARVETGDRVTLVESGSPPSILLGPAAPKAELGTALDSYEPWRARHDPTDAIDLARGLAAPGRVTFFTDRDLPEGRSLESDVAWVALGRATPNVGFVAAQRGATAQEGLDVVDFTIGCFGPPGSPLATRSLRVRVVGAESDLAAPKDLEFDAGERRTFSIEVPSADAPIELLLSSDAFSPDDSIVLVPARRSVLRIASTLPDPAARELGFESGRGASLDRLLALLAPATVVDPELADLIFAVEDVRDSRGDLVVLPLAAAKGEDSERRGLVGPFLIDRADALTEGVALDNVIWTVSPSLSLPGSPLVSAGNLPLWSREEDSRRTVHRFDYDPFRSNVHRAPDWPILLVNIGQATRERLPGLARSNLAVGDELQWRSPWGDSPVTVTLELDGVVRREYVSRGTLSVDVPTPPGAWTLRAVRAEGDEREVVGFSVGLLDPGSSDLLEPTTVIRDATAPIARAQAPESTTTALLALVLLALLVADAWVTRPASRPAAAGATR